MDAPWHILRETIDQTWPNAKELITITDVYGVSETRIICIMGDSWTPIHQSLLSEETLRNNFRQLPGWRLISTLDNLAELYYERLQMAPEDTDRYRQLSIEFPNMFNWGYLAPNGNYCIGEVEIFHLRGTPFDAINEWQRPTYVKLENYLAGQTARLDARYAELTNVMRPLPLPIANEIKEYWLAG